MRPLRATLGAGLLAVLALAGCSGNSAYKPNLPPETTLFVQFDAGDTVSHTVPYDVHLFWIGQDTDGFISAFEIRFKDPARPADTTWVRTTRTDSVIAVATPNGISTPAFEVRAIDDDGDIDPTPAHQDFPFIQGSARTFTTWIPLGECPRELGGLQVNAGTHLLGEMVVPKQRRQGVTQRMWRGQPRQQTPHCRTRT